jgi:hypothetical protein
MKIIHYPAVTINETDINDYFYIPITNAQVYASLARALESSYEAWLKHWYDSVSSYQINEILSAAKISSPLDPDMFLYELADSKSSILFIFATNDRQRVYTESFAFMVSDSGRDVYGDMISKLVGHCRIRAAMEDF